MDLENLFKKSFTFIENQKLQLIKEEMTFFKLKVKTRKERTSILAKRKICDEEIKREIDSIKILLNIFNYSSDNDIIKNHKEFCRKKMKVHTDFYNTITFYFEEARKEIEELQKFGIDVDENIKILKDGEITCFEHLLMAKTYTYINDIYQSI